MAPSPEDELILEPAYADDFETIYGDGFNETMAGTTTPYIRMNRRLENKTLEEGERLVYNCEAAASPLPITFVWQKNHVRVEPSRRIRIKNSEHQSKLRIKNVRPLDTGHYSCIATNQVGSANTTAVLKVQPGASVRRPSSDRRPSSRESMRRLEGLGTQSGGRGLGQPGGSGVGSAGRVGGGGPQSIASPFGEGRVGEGSCVLYQGQSCAPFLRGQHVLVSTTNREEALDMERDLKAMSMHVEGMPVLSSDCKRISIRIACFHKYKLCDPFPRPGISPSLPICREECKKVAEELCEEGFTLAKANQMVGANSYLPVCDELPASDRCVPVLEENTPPAVNPLHWCYVGNGKSFRGTAHNTDAGDPCLPWHSQSPARQFRPSAYPELQDAAAFCRNPGGHKTRPWCYSARTRSEANCNISRCPDDLFPDLRQSQGPLRGIPTLQTTSTRTPPLSSTPAGFDPAALWNSLGSTWQYGLLAAGGGGLVLLLALLCCCLCRCCRKKKPKPGKPHMNGSATTAPSYLLNNSATSSSTHNRAALFPGANGAPRNAGLAGNGMELNQLLPQSFPPHAPPSSFGGSTQGTAFKISIPNIPPSQLAVAGELLGDGKFGAVWKGEMAGYGGSPEEPVQVAVMQLPEDSLPRAQAEWAAEVERAAQLRHPNVLELVGTVAAGTLVFDFAAHGDLHKFLLMRSPYTNQDADATQIPDIIRSDQAEFLLLASQIAAGMEYLASFGIVHGDLAARNCFIAGRQQVKLASFGFRRKGYESDYARLSANGAPIPLRWMPPQNGPYPAMSTESDIWAFGVTLWELFSYGMQPYFGYDDPEVRDLIYSRHLLETPDSCPSRMYSLMVECWSEVGSRRPRFDEIANRLGTWTTMASPAASSALSAAPYAFHGAVPANRSGSVHSGTSASIPTSTQGHNHHQHALTALLQLQKSSGKSPASSQRSGNNFRGPRRFHDQSSSDDDDPDED